MTKRDMVVLVAARQEDATNGNPERRTTYAGRTGGHAIEFTHRRRA